LNFFFRVKEVQEKYSRQVSSGLAIPKDSAIEKLKSGKYLLEDTRWLVKKEIFEKIVKDLIKLFKIREEKTDTLEKLFSTIPDTVPAELAKLIEHFTRDKKDLEPAEIFTVNYILWQTLGVFYKKEADRFRDMDYQLYWTETFCPVCGNPPKISRLLQETGKRMVSCYLCWTEWVVNRITCPYCSNTSQDTLGYFYADGNKAYRVDVCSACNKYLKTIDENVLNMKVIPEVEDVITYHLDTLAFSEGYETPLKLLYER
jgi:FdhE protein